MGPPPTQDDTERPRQEAEGAPCSPAPAATDGVPAAADGAPAAADGAPGGPLPLAELEDEECGSFPEGGTALDESMCGEGTPKAGAAPRKRPNNSHARVHQILGPAKARASPELAS